MKPAGITGADLVTRPLADFGSRRMPLFKRCTKAVKIHICKDGTFTYRRGNQRVFNGVALCVYSVDTIDEAQQLETLMCFCVKAEHPQLKGKTWYKVNDVLLTGRRMISEPPFSCPTGVFELDDLGPLSEKMHAIWNALIARRSRRSRKAS